MQLYSELRYKTLEKGYIFYNINEDGVDNGGKEKEASKTKEWDITFKVER